LIIGIPIGGSGSGDCDRLQPFLDTAIPIRLYEDRPSRDWVIPHNVPQNQS
jgi:hypothetical protein